MPRYRVPASTTNLGHGFDCLGMALALYNTIDVEPLANEAIETPDSRDAGLAAMVARVRDACAQRWRVTLPGLSVRVTGDIPIARGLGSSASIIVGVAAACRDLAGLPQDQGELIRIGAAIEGHPDNVAAAVLGGFTIVGQVGDDVRWTRFDPPADLTCVLVIPPYEVKTSEARRILPDQVTKRDLVTAIQRTALIVAALARGRVEDLRGLFADAWHERYRAQVNVAVEPVRAAAARVAAIGTIISGSGSTVLSFTDHASADRIADALQGTRTGTVMRVECAGPGMRPA
ncbi:MAG TPA: homoserine kinase [Planctomycetota bacterium]|nr:homoserine kinase [Planctomycetota bacterium]